MSRSATGAGEWPETLRAGGDMGRRMLEHDWSRTPLGPIREWPTTLRTVVSLVVENSFPSVLWWGGELTALYNDAYRTLLGTKADALGRSLREIWPEVLDTLEPVVARAQAGQASLFHNTRFTLHRNGRPEEAWFDWGFSPVRDDTGAVVGVLNTAIEQTERTRNEQALKRSEEALLRSETLLQAVLDQMPSGVYVAQAPSGRILYHNAAAEAILGHPRIEAEDRKAYHAYHAMHPDGSPYATQEHPLARALAGESVEQQEVIYRRGDGDEITLAVNAAPVRDESGETILAVTTLNDITYLKCIQDDLRRLNETLEQQVQARTEQVREKEERFRRLVEASAASVWTSGPEGAMAEVSPSWREYTGQTIEESRDDGWLEAIHPDDREMVREDWERCVAEGGSQNLEHRVWNEATQSYRWVAGRSVPLRDANGDIRGWIGMDVDIDERKRAEQRVRELAARLTVAEQEERRRIAQVLHDDLQQMLHGVAVKLDIVMRDLRDPRQPNVMEDLKEARWWIAQGVSATRTLTADLSPPILGHENLTDSLRWLCRHMGDLHELDVDMDASHPFPLPDDDLRVLLFNVVRELLFNVKKHAGVSRARLDLEEEDDRLVIHVIDNGKGFDPAPAWIGDASARGFGLFSIQERLALRGGWLELDTTPGDGTHVRVVAPLG